VGAAPESATEMGAGAGAAFAQGRIDTRRSESITRAIAGLTTMHELVDMLEQCSFKGPVVSDSRPRRRPEAFPASPPISSPFKPSAAAEVKSEPLPGSLSAVSEPPMALASLRLIASPSPAPLLKASLAGI